MRIGKGFTRTNLLKLVVIFYIGGIFLPIVFNNLPLPFRSYIFRMTVVFGCFLFLSPKSFIKKELVWFYLFIGIMLLLNATVWEGRRFLYEGFAKNYSEVFLALLLFWHYVDKGDFGSLWMLCKISLILSFFSIINNFFVLRYFPSAMDLIVSGVASDAYYDRLTRLGYIGYGFFNGISSYSPAMFYGMKNRLIKLRYRIAWFILFAAMLTVLPGTSVATFVLFALLFGSTSLFMGYQYKRDLYRMFGMIVIVILLPRSFISGAFYKSAEIINVPGISERFVDAGRTIDDPYIDYYNSTEHSGKRLGRIPLLWQSFLRNPLTGGGFNTGHVAWFDMLSLYGILGTFPWIMLIYTNTRRTVKKLPKSYVPYYLLGSMAFLSMGFIKNTGGNHVWFFWFFILPGTAYFAIPKLHTSVTSQVCVN